MQIKGFQKRAIGKKKGRGELGFTLLEMIVAMTLFLIVIGSIYGLMQIGRTDRSRASRRSDILKNARIAMHLIGRDALNAGLGYHKSGAYVPDGFLSTTFGIPADVNTERDRLTAVMVGNNVNINTLSLNPASRTDVIGFAFRDLDFNAPPPSAGVTPMGDVININGASGAGSTARITSSTGTGAAAAQRYDLYLVEGNSSQVAIMATSVNGTNRVEAQPGDPVGLNQPYNGTGDGRSVLFPCASIVDENCMTYPSTLKRFFMIGYRVLADGTLVRTQYGNNRGQTAANQIVQQPLAYNVEDLQIEYVLKDGFLTDNPVAGPDRVLGTPDDDEAAVNLIRQITITIKVQARENDEQAGTPDTITLTSTFSTRNIEYDAS